MCYLIAKNNQGGSSLAIQMMHGKELTSGDSRSETETAFIGLDT